MRPGNLLRAQPFRIGLAYAALFAISVSVIGGVMIWRLSVDMYRDLKAGIVQESVTLRRVYQLDGWDALKEHVVGESAPSIAAADIAGPHFLLLDPAGRRVAGDLPVMPPFSGWSSTILEGDDDPYEGEGDADDLDRVTVPLFGAALPDGYLIVGMSRHGIEEMQDTFLAAGAWGAAVSVLLALAGGALMGRGSLRWVDAVNETIDRVVDSDLSRRLPVGGAGRELDELSANINGMLDRIQELMEGMRQVTNDIAHDLRTPLTRLRQRLLTAQNSAADAPDREESLQAAIQETEGILETFDALLRIAEIEGGARRARFEGVALDELAEEIVDTYCSLAADNHQTLVADIESGVRVNGDRGLLAQMLVNLLENSLQYAGAGSRIEVRVAGRAGKPEIVVADSGPGIPAGERDRVVERFYRLEASRSTPGSGLGLALVSAVAGLHGMRLTLGDNAPGLIARIA